LSRFYALHMMLIPGLIGALIGAHLYLVVKLGTTAPPWLRADRKPKASRSHEVDAIADGNRADGNGSAS
jgi:quinol-cytochrome oxidoreductase complex cytochrome b subunit